MVAISGTVCRVNTTTMTKVQQAEAWLREYLKDGPRAIPDSYWKHGLARYNYPPNILPPEGIGPKVIDRAITNIGVIVSHTGPNGGKRWQLPEHITAVDDTQSERDALAQKVASVFQAAFAKLEEYRADIERLWKEFENLKHGETIMGCRTKTEFCTKVLGRSIRAVQYLLSGGNPVSKRTKRETVSRPALSGAKKNTSIEPQTLLVHRKEAARFAQIWKRQGVSLNDSHIDFATDFANVVLRSVIATLRCRASRDGTSGTHANGQAA